MVTNIMSLLYIAQIGCFFDKWIIYLVYLIYLGPWIEKLTKCFISCQKLLEFLEFLFFCRIAAILNLQNSKIIQATTAVRLLRVFVIIRS